MKCAVYTRVSTNKEEQKASLINQREMFMRYIAEHNWDLYNIYVDVQSGTKDKKREQLKQMLQDAKEKKFDIILAKELSRLARNGGLSYKIRDLAIQNGIHIITLDNAINTLTGNMQMFGIFASIYENESQNTSRRVKDTLDNRANNGLFKGSTPPFGYTLKDGKFYIRQDDTPNIVKRIFKEYLSGDGQDTIAKRLWQEGIPTPSEAAGKANAGTKWHGSTIMDILRNRAYIGDMVQSKEKMISVTCTKRKINPEEDWVVKENTHEPIVPKETFTSVQQLIKTRSRLKKAAPKSHLFTNILFCADCGHGMHFKANRKGYVCGNYDKYGNSACNDHIVREKELTEAVLKDLNKLISCIKNKNLTAKIEKKVQQYKNKYEKELAKYNREIDQLSTEKNNALRKLVNDIITKEQYDMLTNEDNMRLLDLTKKQQEYKTLIAQYDINNCIKDLSKLQEQVLNITELTPEILNRFIEKIEIKKDGTPKIYYRFSGSSIYFSTLFNCETHSTCAVPGNISTGWVSTTSYPNPSKIPRSLANVAGSHDT